MADKTGAVRLRQAIKNQRDLGNGEFRLTYHDAEELAAEIDAELLEICSSAERETGRYAWAPAVPAPVDADGEVVPLGTEVMYDISGREYEGSLYRSFIWSREKGRWYFGVIGGLREVASLHLNYHDSWEKLEKDVSKTASEDICGYFGFALNKPCSAECPVRDVSDSCAVAAVRDVMRRAKALAERGAMGPTPQASPHGAKEVDRD